ncbi:MAG: hypothetical protein K2X87_23485 [Gemmataceae bacterium]|nr:hypothetical protein [Gemmataceae bacterium]
MAVNADLEATKLEFGRAAAGIRRPTVVTLPAGEALFRFASTKNPRTGEPIPSHLWALGAWWFREPDYRLILQRYQAGKLGLGTVGRMAGAVQPSWSLMDVSVKARLVDALGVYAGKAVTQYNDRLPNGARVTLAGWPDVDQVYIPGMGGAAPALSALQIVRKKVITTDGLGFPAG